jgi:hypothetical protein
MRVTRDIYAGLSGIMAALYIILSFFFSSCIFSGSIDMVGLQNAGLTVSKQGRFYGKFEVIFKGLY